MKIKFFAALLFLVPVFYAVPKEKISAKVEDSSLKARYIRYGQLYSYALTMVHNSAENTFDSGFSFYSDHIKAGRLKPSGIWRELSNPFGYQTDSSVYWNETGAGKDFENSTGGISGAFVLLPFGTSVTCILNPVQWAGLITNIPVSDQISFHFLFRVDEKRDDTSSEWRDDYPRLAISEPFYSGVEVQSVFSVLKMKTLMVLSGNPYFRAGFLLRNVMQASFPLWDLSALVLYGDKDFILTSGKPEDGHFLSSAAVQFSPFGWVSITLDGEYRIDDEVVYPSYFTGSRFDKGICVQLEKGPLQLTVKGSDAAVFHSSGSTDTSYSVESSVKAEKEPFSGKLIFAETGEEGNPFRRKGTLVLSGKTAAFSLSTTVSFIKDIHTCPLYCFEGGIAVVLYTQNAVISMSFRKSTYTGETHYSIGFDSTISERNVQFQNRLKALQHL